MKLFDIAQEIEACVIDGENAVNTETGEVIDRAALDALQMDFNDKAENIALWIKNLDAEADAVKNQKLIFAARQKAVENKRDSLKEYLATCLQGKAFKTDKVKVSYRKSEVITVQNIEKVPTEFLKYSAPTVDKAEVKKEIKAGKAVPGCALETKQNIQIK